ncbi:MAG: DMT family transporter [Rhodobacteraceae bacterium]|jgi:drug/metabolite transporter (DMT)-like permease|nr:DMT family transporter [Paracoccaceae bacterium]
MTEQNTRKGIWLMIATTMVFAGQDALSRLLVENNSILLVVMIRFWVHAAFVTVLAARRPGGLAATVRTRQPGIQILRGLLLAGEICLMVLAFSLLGLVETHAIFTCYPLLVAALSGPVLGERVGWRRWTAIGVGFLGVLVILQPGSGAMSLDALVAFGAALSFALYGLLTRYAARRDDPATSFFWTGIIGAVAMTGPGLWAWAPMTPMDSLYMAALSGLAILGHWLLIRAYDVAEASAVQPFAYFQLVWVTILGVTLFGEVLRWNVVVGALIVVAAGLFTLWREQVRRRAERQG